MIRKLNLLLLLVTIGISFGCSTQSILLDVYSAPKMELPPEVRTFSVFSRFVPATGDYERVQWGAFDSVDSVMLAASDTCIKAFNQLFDSYDRYATIMPIEPMFKHNGNALPDPLPWDGLAKIANRNHTNGIIILESFGLEESEPKIKQENSTYFAEIEVTVSTGWRSYQPKLRRLLDEKIYHDQFVIHGEGVSKEAAVKDLPEKSERMILASTHAGEKYAKLMKPLLIQVKRNYYVKGSPVIEEAAEYVSAGEWGKAEGKWNYYTYHGENDKEKAMCSYNMALLSEKEGYLNKSLGFARGAQKLMPSKLHLELINALTTRSLDLEEKYKSGQITKNW